jgi:two-component system sensor histidine kinase KdpD
MSDQPSDRPDPDALLARIRREEAQAARGKLKIFFGASAGVGKTYAMLSSAASLRKQGVDVVVGIVETHGRRETASLLDGFEVLPQREVSYRNRVLREFDLDAALSRKPALILVDELAHSNAPGSRHPKRWLDVEELIAAGIDVWTTVNVQHIETLSDIVGGITGIRVSETVPDRVFDQADEVVMVDLPPDDLLRRLSEGKVYVAEQAATAVRNFFRKGNLIALRELALRRAADRVDGEMLEHRRTAPGSPVWPTRGALLLCIGPDPRAERLVRSAARMAAQLEVPWHCIYVETPRLAAMEESRRQHAMKALQLAEQSGAIAATLSAARLAQAVVRYAREYNLSRVVLGRDTGRDPPAWRRTLAAAVGRLGPDLDVIQIALPQSASGGEARRSSAAGASRGSAWVTYLLSALICSVTALLAAPLYDVFELSNIVMLFLLAVVVVAVLYGRGPAVLAAFLAVGLFDFFYVPPRFSFAVSDVQYLLTFSVMLLVALVIGQLTAALRWQARVTADREERVGALYALARELSAALLAGQIAEIGVRFVRSEFGAQATLLLPDESGAQLALVQPAGRMSVDLGIAQWAYEHGEPAGHGTNTLAAAAVLYVPLKAPVRIRGVLAVLPGEPAAIGPPEVRRLLETCASLLAIALERIHYVEVAQSTTLHVESERLRNSLLAAISHDLRTPLAALIGMTDMLATATGDESADTREVAHQIRQAAQRMHSQVNNLLDMARLESGRVRVQRQWLPLEEAVGSALRASASVLDPKRVQVDLPDDLPLLQVDPSLFERVLCNLFENAAKYTPAGTPVRIQASAADRRVRVFIDDSGPGLPKGREEAIFAKFERGERESATPGVGLGLAICRAIISAHGGTIEAHTRTEGGTRFVIDLPCAEAPPVVEAASDSAAASAP